VVIEDSRLIGVLVQKTLEPLGHTVEVLDAEFAQIAESHDWSGVDVVVCDRFLDGYDGAEILKWIAEHAPAVHRVMLTGDRDMDLDGSFAEKLLIKPVDLAAIENAVEVW
jgi:DNA-binding NtrC family response regulator